MASCRMLIRPAHSCRPWRITLISLTLSSVLTGLFMIGPAAQELQSRKEATERELAEIRDEIRLSESKRNELAAEIANLEKDRSRINTSLIDASNRQREIENRIDRSSARLEKLRAEQERVRSSLRNRKALLSEVLASLQRMSRHPPPAILVAPDDALSAVRSAILLGAVIPEIRAETDVLVAELTELTRIGEAIDDQRRSLAGDLRASAEEEQRLNLLLAEKRQMTNAAREELASQSALAAELAARATSMGRLIETLEREIASARKAADAAKKAEEESRLAAVQPADPEDESRSAENPEFANMARIKPAIEFEKAQGLLPLPVSGVIIRNFGARGPAGESAEGISVATRINARVIAPADGWVVYSGPFRSYGQLLILNTGSGYHVVMAGMEKSDVQLGQFVLAGEPIAQMGARRVASVEAVGLETSRPVLYVEFRNQGKPVDPSPWWADATLKRVADDS